MAIKTQYCNVCRPNKITIFLEHLCRKQVMFLCVVVEVVSERRGKMLLQKICVEDFDVFLLADDHHYNLFSLVIAILWIHFDSELSKLRLSIENFDNSRAGGDQSKATLTAGGNSSPCICSDSGLDSQTTGGDGGVNAGAGNIQGGTGSQNLLNCCSANQETLERLITKAVEDEKQLFQQSRPEIQQPTLGEIERQIQRLLQNNRTQVQPSLGSSRSSIPVAVHVTRASTCTSPGQQIESNRIKVGPWEASNGLAFSENVVNDGYHLIVPKSGLYLVYSQVYFRYERENAGSNIDDNELLHFTSHVNDARDLMKSVSIREGEVTYITSFHSGLFKLREGDKIYMKVYLPSSEVKVGCPDESTFMGMNMVNEDIET
ncbi:tumor necrosis factor ligand superfamily member 10-like [Ptychodera flava]|uniref:tumor necrosis factor ligand superfamily member 10-like n=1 Tax=Ptychodera flava TaxID=63121 RepID=UPI003969F892